MSVECIAIWKLSTEIYYETRASLSGMMVVGLELSSMNPAVRPVVKTRVNVPSSQNKEMVRSKSHRTHAVYVCTGIFLVVPNAEQKHY